MTTQKIAKTSTTATKTKTTTKKAAPKEQITDTDINLVTELEKPTNRNQAEAIKVVDSTESRDLSIDLYGGKTTFFPESVRIAKDVHECLTTQQAIKIAGLDWPVLETELTYTKRYRDSGGNLVEKVTIVPNHKMIYKSNGSEPDDIFHLSSESWTPVQNSTAFEFFDPILYDGTAKLDTAIMLDGGRKIAITAKISGLSADIGNKNDQVDSYIVLYNGHDGKLCLGVMFTPVRVICQNTLAFAIGKEKKKGRNSDTSIRLKHTSRIDQNLKLVTEAINMNKRSFDMACSSYKAMTKYNLTDEQYREYLESVFESELANHDSILTYKHYGMLNHLYRDGVGSNLSGGTIWQAYQSVTEFLSHRFGVKQNEDLNTDESTATRLNNLLFGKTAMINKTAFLEAQRLTTVM
jgi:phage/plasmid-like protein (TIGR03299 family)